MHSKQCEVDSHAKDQTLSNIEHRAAGNTD